MKKYTIGLITGALLAVSAMMFMGSQNKNLGDITVNSITVLDDGYGGFIKTYNTDGKQTVYLGTSTEGFGFLKTSDADGKQTVYLGTAEQGFGFLSTSNADGKQTVYLGTSSDNSGHLTLHNGGTVETYNEHELRTGYFGTNIDNDGVAVLFDRYGDEGWSASGKQ